MNGEDFVDAVFPWFVGVAMIFVILWMLVLLALFVAAMTPGAEMTITDVVAAMGVGARRQRVTASLKKMAQYDEVEFVGWSKSAAGRLQKVYRRRAQ